MNVCVLIPARMKSSRLPGKVLTDIAGKPMLQHVYESAQQAICHPDVFIATGDDEIVEAVTSFGGRVIRTYGDHRSGTDRIAEAVDSLSYEVVVNVQADEPMLRPAEIDGIVAVFEDSAVQMASVYRSARDLEELKNPNRVKVCIAENGDALSFCRRFEASVTMPVGDQESPHIHLGIYGYRRERLLAFSRLPQSENEKECALEQLRAMDHGWSIRMVHSEWAGMSVDTSTDLELVRTLMDQKQGTARC